MLDGPRSTGNYQSGFQIRERTRSFYMSMGPLFNTGSVKRDQKNFENRPKYNLQERVSKVAAIQAYVSLFLAFMNGFVGACVMVVGGVGVLSVATRRSSALLTDATVSWKS